MLKVLLLLSLVGQVQAQAPKNAPNGAWVRRYDSQGRGYYLLVPAKPATVQYATPKHTYVINHYTPAYKLYSWDSVRMPPVPRPVDWEEPVYTVKVQGNQFLNETTKDVTVQSTDGGVLKYKTRDGRKHVIGPGYQWRLEEERPSDLPLVDAGPVVEREPVTDEDEGHVR